MLNIAAFINPLQHSPNPTAAVGNAIQARGLEYSNANEKARLAEQAREMDQSNALQTRGQDFRELSGNREFEQHRQELHTKLVEWGTGVLDREGPEKARQIVGPVWEAAGIGVDFGDGPGPSATGAAVTDNEATETTPDSEMAELEAAQGRRGSLDEYSPEASSTGPKPGESFSTYVSRNTAKPTGKTVEAQATEGPEAAQADEAVATVAQAPRPWKIIDKSTGRVLGVIDPQKVASINLEKAQRRAEAYVSGTPDNRKGIIEGFTSAAETPEEVETGMKHGEFTYGQLEKTERTKANHRGGGGGLVIGGLVADGVNTKLLNQLDTQARANISKAVANSGVPQLQKRANELMSVDSMFDSDNPAAQRQAFSSILRSFSGAQVSDRERAFFEQNAGFWSAMNNKIQTFVGGGQMDPTLREDMRKAAAMMNDQAQAQLSAIAHEAADAEMRNPSTGQLYKDALGKRWTPEAEAAKRKSLENLGHVDTGNAPAGQSDADREALELMGH